MHKQSTPLPLLNIYALFCLHMQLNFDKGIKINNYALKMHNYLADSKFKLAPLGTKISGPIATVSVVGARGYSGLELIKLLKNHPTIELKYAFATSQFNLSEELMNSSFANIKCLHESEIFTHLTDIVFLATPAEVSLKLAPELIKKGAKVIDLSGAFRLKKSDYQRWYGFSHTHQELLTQAHYGLQSFSKNSISPLVSNPGCYATAISMALIPLLKHHLVSPNHIVIDAKSGTTGAGKKPLENLLFSEVDGECLPYKVGCHQHLPEIQECIESFTSLFIEPHFTTSLLSVSRGIIAGIYLNSLTTDIEQIKTAYLTEYQNYPLVRFSSKISQFASLKKVVGTPYTNISFELVGTKLYVFSCIDNLLKGAASQAIENLNSILGLPLEFSLISQTTLPVSQPHSNNQEALL